jgi:hypothetical protein
MNATPDAGAKRSEGVKVLVRQYFQRLMNEKDLSVCDEMLSNEYIQMIIVRRRILNDL